MIGNLTKYNVSLTTDYTDKSMSIPVIYSDDYLRNEMLDLNLARLCCTLCCGSYNEEIIKNAFKECEFHSVRTYYTEPDENTASFVVARRGNNIFVVIRGTEGKEWYNNFRTGLEDTHQGYYETVEYMMPLLREYIESDCNILFTGHSRGGALSNLLSSDLIRRGRKNVFAYTFGCPNVTTRNDVDRGMFRNIHNFVYEDDFITHCPLPEWGYSRYGTTVKFRNKEIRTDKLKEAFNNLTGLNYKTFSDLGEDISNFTDTALRLASNTYEYYNKGYLVDEDYMTLYDYFQTVCDLFNDNDAFMSGITLLATKLSAFAPISNFLVSGIDITKFISQESGEGSCAMFAHSCLNYLCLMNTQKIKAP